MHELPITQTMLDLVLEHADRAGGGRVTDIHVVIGALSSYVDDSIQFYWDIISRGTPADGARLHFRRVPLQFECRTCHALFTPDGESFRCTACSSDRVRVAAGDEMRVEAIEVEEAPAASATARSS